MLNQILPVASWQMMTGDRGDLALLWLEALGTDAVVVPDKTSLEPYHDYEKPEKFRDVAEAVYDDQRGTVIYRVPRRFPGIGRVVDTAGMAAVGPIHGGDDIDTLKRYVAAVEQNPATVQWKGFEEVDVQANVAADQSVLLQESYDPAWRAYENGKPLPLRIEPVMNFMLVDVPPGNHILQLRFGTPLENRIGQGVTLLGFAAVIWLIAIAARRSRPDRDRG